MFTLIPLINVYMTDDIRICLVPRGFDETNVQTITLFKYS